MNQDDFTPLYSQKDVQSSKYDLDDWEAFEVKLTPSEREVIEMLKKTALPNAWKSVTSESERTLTSYGDLYLTIREDKTLAVRLGLLPVAGDEKEDLSKKKPAKQKGLTKEEIIIQSTLGKLQRDVEDLKHRWKTTDWTAVPMIRAMDSVEMIVLFLIHHLRECEQQYLAEDMEESAVYALIFGISKVIHGLQTATVRDIRTSKHGPVHPQLIKDLHRAYQAFAKRTKYSILTAAKKYPKLLLKTPYDHILPGLAMAPYESQLRIIELLQLHREKGLFACLNTLTGEGKTTLVVAIAQLAMNLSSYHTQYEVIYCCSEKLKTVRQQVGKHAYTGSIPFGVAVTDPVSEEVRITDSYNCKRMKHDRVLTIADIVSTIKLLSNPPPPGREYILFFDEPTVGLDQPDSPMISYLSSVYALAPRLTLFSTATAPERESIPLLETLFRTKWPEAHVEFIKSKKVLIGSEIASLEGAIYLPHQGCRTVEEFNAVLKSVEGNAFLQKCYTANIVFEMYQTLRILKTEYSISIESAPSFEEYMMIPGNMNQQAIGSIALVYLRLISSLNRADIVTAFCAPSFKKPGIRFEELASKGILENQTLLVTTDPLSFFDTHFTAYLNEVHEELQMPRRSFSELFLRYDALRLEYEEKRKKIMEKVAEKAGSSSRQEKNGMDYEMERQQRLSELTVPTLGIEERWIIGSSAYLKARKSTTPPRLTPVLENIDWTRITCEDRHSMGLALGVGIFSPSRMDLSYTRTVIDLASNGLLAYLIADDDICYGTNYPIENVIVDDTCLTRHSVKTVFQVFARAGRPGKSWKASIYAADAVLDMIRRSVHLTKEEDLEVENMNIALEGAMEAVTEFRSLHTETIVMETPPPPEEEKDIPVVSSAPVDAVPDSWEDE
jgi:energy-coupling factor transporter ATP-binding protein EcfA2